MSRKSIPARRNTGPIVTLAILGVLAVLAVGYWKLYGSRAAVTPVSAPQKLLGVGDPAPPFDIRTETGEVKSTKLAGKAWLVEVLAVWCPHCQHEAPWLTDVEKKYDGRIAVVGIIGSPFSFDGSTPVSQGDVTKFAADFGAGYPIGFDLSGANPNPYLRGGFPSLTLVAPDGKVAWVTAGEVDPKVLDQHINAVLK